MSRKKRTRAPCPPAADSRVDLTPRESEVIVLLIRDLTFRQIAADLRVTRATIKFHTRNIYRKLAVKNRLGAALWALRDPTLRAVAFPAPTGTPAFAATAQVADLTAP